MAVFEKISKYDNVDIQMPVRKTANSAGYDMVAAEDIIVPSYNNQMRDLMFEFSYNNEYENPLTIDEISVLTKKTKAKPTLVPTGMKCKLDPDTYLELSVRSSSPLKSWLMLANSVGIIDSDYYNNPDNEGHIYFQMINLSPFDILIRKGEALGQGIIKRYEITDDDVATGERTGGFGSTDRSANA